MLPKFAKKEIIERLKTTNPDEIILFGSYAKEETTLNSDIDILVIKDTNPKKLHKLTCKLHKKLRSFEKKYRVEVDIFADTPEGIKQKLEVDKDRFYMSIFKSGVSLYKKNKHSFVEKDSKESLTIGKMLNLIKVSIKKLLPHPLQ